MARDRAGEGPSEKEVIRQLNRDLEQRGAKSRYVDAAPEEDYRFEEATKDDRFETDHGTMDDIPVREQLAADGAMDITAQELIDRGLGPKYGLVEGVPVAVQRATPRIETLDKIIRYHKNQMGYIHSGHLDEWIELTGNRHPEDFREA